MARQMSKPLPAAVGPGAVRRALILGLALFVVFALAGGLLWLLGTALGLPRITAFFLAACAGPLLVAGALLLWLLAQPLERRQHLLGIAPSTPQAASAAEDSAAPEPSPRSTTGSGHLPGG